MTSRLDATTWRVICPNFGQAGHDTHVVPVRETSIETFENAEAVAASNDRLYERLAKGADGDLYWYYRSEIGWIVQKQTVSQWVVVGYDRANWKGSTS